ncbi:hypothetical protein L484_015536 [Morus notabilis]|uniref:Uncharacterized protein n=1 Tax=Morus notabilis TaxID=981085 RepID=W9RS47_9ROSA|nr:hypothetical protein L484_015536 [Morus notabilis]
MIEDFETQGPGLEAETFCILSEKLRMTDDQLHVETLSNFFFHTTLSWFFLLSPGLTCEEASSY